MGLARIRVSTECRELLPPDFTLIPINRDGMFLWRYPSGHPAWTLSSTLPGWSSDFPLRVTEAATRPTGPLLFYHS